MIATDIGGNADVARSGDRARRLSLRGRCSSATGWGRTPHVGGRRSNCGRAYQRARGAVKPTTAAGAASCARNTASLVSLSLSAADVQTVGTAKRWSRLRDSSLPARMLDRRIEPLHGRRCVAGNGPCHNVANVSRTGEILKRATHRPRCQTLGEQRNPSIRRFEAFNCAAPSNSFSTRGDESSQSRP